VVGENYAAGLEKFCAQLCAGRRRGAQELAAAGGPGTEGEVASSQAKPSRDEPDEEG